MGRAQREGKFRQGGAIIHQITTGLIENPDPVSFSAATDMNNGAINALTSERQVVAGAVIAVERTMQTRGLGERGAPELDASLDGLLPDKDQTR